MITKKPAVLRAWCDLCVVLNVANSLLDILDLTREPADDDLLFERDGAKLYVPLKAMPFIDGTTVDYVREGLNQIFKFNNPKAQHACGCGESFGV